MVWYAMFTFESNGLKNSEKSLCFLLVHSLKANLLLMWVFMLMMIIYFNISDEVEQKSEGLLSTISNVDFIG